MVSQPVINVIIGALLSGILLIINSWWMSWNNNKFQLEREEKQRTWQLEREEQQRIWQEKSDKQKWDQEKIYECYRKSFQALIKLQQEEVEKLNRTNDIIKGEQIRTNINKLILEFTTEFNMIIPNHPDKNSEEFTKKLITIDESLRKDSSKVRPIIIKIMEHDSRI